VRQIEAGLLKKLKKHMEQEIPGVESFLGGMGGQRDS
jgi:hypothetical protein